jgi:hypothetical protein
MMRQKQKQLRTKLNDVVKSKSGFNLVLKMAGLLLVIFLIYTIVQYDLLFRTFVVLFLIGQAYFFNKKFKAVTGNQESEISEPVIEKIEDQKTQIFDKALTEKVTEKEEQLEKIDFDRTQMLEELFSKAELNDLEKQTYRDRIKQKESERSDIIQDLMIVKGKWHNAVLETKKYFVKADPMKEIAASIESEKIENASIATLNKEVQAIISSSLSEETIQALLKGHYVDEEYNLTRSGYKALMKTLQKETIEG